MKSRGRSRRERTYAMHARLSLFFDTCAFHPPIPNERKATDDILSLVEAEEIPLALPRRVDKELMRAPSFVRAKALVLPFTRELSPSSSDQEREKLVGEILFPGLQHLKPNQINDVDNVAEAKKYDCCYFVTFDKKDILSKAPEILQKLNMHVVSPSKCLRIIKEWLEQNPILDEDN